MRFDPANFGLPIGLSIVELDRGTRQTDRQKERHTKRRADRHRPSFYNAPSHGGRRNNKLMKTVGLQSSSLVLAPFTSQNVFEKC